MELAREGVDVVMVSDVDEIPKPGTVEVLKQAMAGVLLGMRSEDTEDDKFMYK
jgi:hypothetical protein